MGLGGLKEEGPRPIDLFGKKKMTVTRVYTRMTCGEEKRVLHLFVHVKGLETNNLLKEKSERKSGGDLSRHHSSGI